MEYCSNCEYGNKTSKLTAQMCSECGYGMDYKYFKSKEDKEMEIRVNRKAMTEQEQREAFVKLLGGPGMQEKEWLNIAMQICKNEPQEVESIDIIYVRGDIMWIEEELMYRLRLTPERIKQIQAIQL